MTATLSPRTVQNALRILFDGCPRGIPQVTELSILEQKELAARFRSRALDMHPDRAKALGIDPEDLNARFKQLHGAYRVLCRLVEDPQLRDSILRSVTVSRDPVAAGNAGLWTPRAARPNRDDRFAGASTDQENNDGRRFYNGRVPVSELRFAQFLYYNRVIDWKTMIDAVTWQYRVRPKVGEIGRSYRFLDFKGVSTVLRQSPRGELFGDTAVRLGMLDIRQLRVMLGKQHQLNYPIGRYFVEHEILSAPEVEHLLEMNKRHNIFVRNSR